MILPLLLRLGTGEGLITGTGHLPMGGGKLNVFQIQIHLFENFKSQAMTLKLKILSPDRARGGHLQHLAIEALGASM
jgi:hypothetical protein